MPHFGLIIIGDEILSGRREDKHLAFVSKLLAGYGYQLNWVRILSDDGPQLVRQFRETFSRQEIVFSCGGIGATPDDKTRQSAAAALRVPIVMNADAVADIESRFGQDAYPQRVKMAEFPEGSNIIPNPVNQIPGFSIQEHYFVPGFPQMAHPMLTWVMQHYYQDIAREQQLTRSYFLHNSLESTWIPFMQEMEERFPNAKVFSLPHMRDDTSDASSDFRQQFDRGMELGVVGNVQDVGTICDAMLKAIAMQGIEYTRIH